MSTDSLEQLARPVNNTNIRKALAPVVGLPLWCIGRAANLLWLHFGELRTVPAHGGGTKSVGQWAIHVQCPWRICRHGRIVVAQQDFYYSPEGDALDDWDFPGKNRFDSVAATLCAEFKSSLPLVASVAPDDIGGFSLHAANDYRLDVFPANSDVACEHWRIFQPGDTRTHFVFREPDDAV
jgi:hypothetical protein